MSLEIVVRYMPFNERNSQSWVVSGVSKSNISIEFFSVIESDLMVEKAQTEDHLLKMVKHSKQLEAPWWKAFADVALLQLKKQKL